MLLPRGLNTRLEKDVSDIFAKLYEKITVDNEDCKIIVFSTCRAERRSIARLDDQRFYT